MSAALNPNSSSSAAPNPDSSSSAAPIPDSRSSAAPNPDSRSSAAPNLDSSSSIASNLDAYSTVAATRTHTYKLLYDTPKPVLFIFLAHLYLPNEPRLLFRPQKVKFLPLPGVLMNVYIQKTSSRIRTLQPLDLSCLLNFVFSKCVDNVWTLHMMMALFTSLPEHFILAGIS